MTAVMKSENNTTLSKGRTGTVELEHVDKFSISTDK